jgi:hypothetical protein
LIQRRPTKEHVSLGGVIAVVVRELVDEPDRVGSPEFSAEDCDGPLSDLRERLILEGYGPLFRMSWQCENPPLFRDATGTPLLGRPRAGFRLSRRR